MVHVIILGFFAVFFAFIAQNNQFRNGLKISFGLIFIFLALRYDYGNDYQSYSKIFDEVNYIYANPNLFDGSIYGEVGWLLMCSIFKPVGFFTMVACLAAVNCIVYYKFIKEFVSPKFYWLAVFIYVFDPGFMLAHLSAMRQSLAIAIFLMALKFIIERRIIPYFLCIIFASFFHSSALIMLPVYFLYLWKPKFNWFGITLVLILFIGLFVFRETLSPILIQLVSGYFSKYSRLFDVDGVVIGSGLGVVFSFIMLTLVLYYSKYLPGKFSILINLVIISFLFIPLSLIFEMFSRPAMYLLPSIIVIYPMSFSYIKERLIQRAIILTYMLYTLYLFQVFFTSDVYQKSYETYHSIIQFF